MIDTLSFIKASFMAFLMRLSSALAGFLITFLVARVLSPADAGIYMLGIAFLTISVAICMLGFKTTFVRYVAAYNAENNNSVIRGIVIFGLLIALIFSVIFSFLIYSLSEYMAINFFSKHEFAPILKLSAFILPFMCIHQLIAYAIQGLHRANLSVFYEKILPSVLFILTIITLVVKTSFEFSSVNLISIFFICTVITFFMSIFTWLFINKFSFKVDFSQSKNIFLSSVPVWVSSIAAICTEWGAQIISGAYLPSDELAAFAISQRTSSIMLLSLVAINLVAAPRFAASFKKNRLYELKETSLFCSRMMFAIAVPLMAIMLFFSEYLLSLFGSGYMKHVDVLRVLLIGQFINVLTGSVGFLLNMTGHEKDMRNIIIVSGVLSLILAFSLIPIYGILGAAISSSISISFQNLFAAFYVQKRLGINTLNLFNQ